MTGRPDRMPGDPAPGDDWFGPLGGLFDDVNHSVRGDDRARDVDGALRLRAPDRERGGDPHLRDRIRAILRRAPRAG
jgi:hypothetical protein